MGNLGDQLEEIKSLLNSKVNKPLAYSMLLNLQQRSAEESPSSSPSSSIKQLAESSRVILYIFLIDIFDSDEEIAALALKCLGFTIHHPTILAEIIDDDVNNIIDSLVKAITTTKIKSVCNLGVWCISIQQLDVSILDMKFDSLLRAVVHALNNPFGSLSITFEAMEAVTKLATILVEKMRGMSSVWAPPIYRRLVSSNKRERDISERCLQKTKSIICPPPSTLSKALLLDMKHLLSGIKELLNRCMKIQALQAWGWMICLLGPYMMKSRNLVNEMLKIPEQTFLGSDPQVQIASLVAWEILIDVLVLPPAIDSRALLIREHGVEQILPGGNNIKTEQDKFVSRVKLIMVPIVGIMSSKCDVSVHAACLNTWSYLLHKLDTSIIWDSVVKLVLEPILEMVFLVGPSEKNIWLWKFCLNILNSYILAGLGNENDFLNFPEIGQESARYHVDEPRGHGKCVWKHYPIKWSLWGLSQLDFIVSMIQGLVNFCSSATEATEYLRLAYTSVIMLFRSLVKVIQNVLGCVSLTYEEIMLCLNTILRFMKSTCEIVVDVPNGLRSTSLHLLEAVLESLNPSVLESPLYQVPLNIEYIKNLKPFDEYTDSGIPGIRLIADANMVPPVVYLSVLYLCQVDGSISKEAEHGPTLNRMEKHITFLLSSYDPVEILQVFIGVLYRKKVLNSLKMWRALANCVKKYISCGYNQSILKMDQLNSVYPVVLSLLAYPFAACSFCQIQLELESITEAWDLLYASVYLVHSRCFPTRSFSDDLVLMLNGYFDRMRMAVDTGIEFHGRREYWVAGLVPLYGNAVKCVLRTLASNSISTGSDNQQDVYNRSRNFKYSLEFSARFMELCLETGQTDAREILSVTSKMFSTLIHSVHRIQLKEDIMAFVKIMSSPLLQWLSLDKVEDKNVSSLLQELWTEILNSLRRSEPPIQFNSLFLKFQELILGRTLDHPDPTITEPTIAFWNSTYGKQTKLEYPQSLVLILDKLTRSGRLNLYKRSRAIGDISRPEEDNRVAALKRCKVTATLNRCSKRVKLAEDAAEHPHNEDKLCSSSGRKSCELTEHQKEVRRAQQGRARDCGGHGPGIHTYTSVDFSQGNGESQDSQDIRDTNSILELLRKVG